MKITTCEYIAWNCAIYPLCEWPSTLFIMALCAKIICVIFTWIFGWQGLLGLPGSLVINLSDPNVMEYTRNEKWNWHYIKLCMILFNPVLGYFCWYNFTRCLTKCYINISYLNKNCSCGLGPILPSGPVMAKSIVDLHLELWCSYEHCSMNPVHEECLGILSQY